MTSIIESEIQPTVIFFVFSQKIFIHILELRFCCFANVIFRLFWQILWIKRIWYSYPTYRWVFIYSITSFRSWKIIKARPLSRSWAKIKRFNFTLKSLFFTFVFHNFLNCIGNSHYSILHIAFKFIKIIIGLPERKQKKKENDIETHVI